MQMMSDQMKALNDIASQLRPEVVEALHDLGGLILEINRENGWNVTRPEDWDVGTYKIPAILSLIHSEVSEALEAYRNGDIDNFQEEMADALIRILDCMAGLELDLAEAVFAKIHRNMTRGYRHGNKRV